MSHLYDIIPELNIHNPKITRIKVSDPSQFQQHLYNRLSDLRSGTPVYGFFEAPWCADCLRAYPIVNDCLNRLDK